MKGMLTLFFFLSTAVWGYGQFKNIKLDDADPSSCATGISVNPRNPADIVAVSGPDNAYITRDGGVNWKKQKIACPVGISGYPTLTRDDKGNLFFFHLPGGGEGNALDRIVVQRSDNGGETWSDGESIGLNPAKYQQRQWAILDGRGNFFVTWTQYEPSGDSGNECQSTILFSLSKNGKKWTEPAVIARNTGCFGDDKRTSGAVPAVTYDGKVFVVWSDGRKIVLDRSFNGGEWWLSNDIQVADQIGGSTLLIPGQGEAYSTPVTSSDHSKSRYRGSLYIVWADQRNGEDDTDIWFTRSHNFGDNWSLPSRVHDDTGGKHQYMPWMCVDPATGYLYIVYYDRSNYDDDRTDVFLSWSIDGGASFRRVKISEEPFTPEIEATSGNLTHISAYGGTITPIWTRFEGGKPSTWTTVIKHSDLEAAGRTK